MNHTIKKIQNAAFMYNLSFSILFFIGFTACTSPSKPNDQTQEDYVCTKNTNGSFPLIAESEPADICLAPEEFAGVKRVIGYFKDDMKRVSGKTPHVYTDKPAPSKSIIVVGTLGHSKLLDELTNQKKIDLSALQGKNEMFNIQIVEHPFDSVEQALVIAGSDKRGTIYGIFEISKQMGVSPWYWWADVPVEQHANLYFRKGMLTDGEPKVKYRGIFLNDEAPALKGWADKKYGGFNHQFYEKVFELILRLRGNYMWPAMWPPSSFNTDDSINAILADELGIVMGTSHHEPLMRAHAEWKNFGGKEWNYETNAEQLRQFWQGGIQRMGNKESIVTIGMRGDGDVGMSDDANTALLEKIVIDQRKIITEVTGKPAEETPQLWALYKEVQEYYDKGMRVPDDVTLLLCDDNWGNVRRLPGLNAPKRKGGYGMYYHFDFVGGPRSYRWLNTNILPRVWEQMHLCYEYGVDQIWIVNVGDLKPMELPISFFLDYAWNPDKWPLSKLEDYTFVWAKQQFGDQHARQIAEILNRYTKYNGRRTPELLYSDSYSLTHYREFERATQAYQELAQQTEQLYQQIPPRQKDAFYQLVYYPVIACSNLYEMYYAHALNLLYAKQGRAATNQMAQKVRERFQKDANLSEYYNKQLANGKWDHMMDQIHIGYTSWHQPDQNIMPATKTLDIPQKAQMGVAVEGSLKSCPQDTSQLGLPMFDAFNNQHFYIEIFNKGKQPFKYEIAPSEPWIKLSKTKGNITAQERIEVSIDWKHLEKGIQKARISIQPENGKEALVNLKASKPDIAQSSIKGFIEQNGYVSIEAPNFTTSENTGQISWATIPGLSRTESGVTTMPVTQSGKKTVAGNPYLGYDFYLLNPPADQQIEANLYFAPTQDFTGKGGLYFALSIDDQDPILINLHEGNDVPDWQYPNWFNTSVSNKTILKKIQLKTTGAGPHTLKYYMVNSGLVLQKIVIDNGGLQPSYLGPPESINMNPENPTHPEP